MLESKQRETWNEGERLREKKKKRERKKKEREKHINRFKRESGMRVNDFGEKREGVEKKGERTKI
jgi:hypothetical protein